MTHGVHVPPEDCALARRLLKRGYMYRTVADRLSVDVQPDTIRHHGLGRCAHDVDEPPASPRPSTERNTDPSVPAIETTRNYES